MSAQLLSLPPELLAQIFDKLRDAIAGKRPICRALLPLTRRNLFRRVVLHSHRRLFTLLRLFHPSDLRSLRSLRASLAGDVDLGMHVRELHLPVIELEQDEGADREDLVAAKRILSSVTDIEVLEVKSSAILRVLLPKKGGFRFSRLSSLSFELLDAKNARLYDMSYFGRLRRFPALKTLSIDISQPDEAEARYLAVPSQVKSLPHIKDLEVSAGLSLSSNSAAGWVSHFLHLDALTLTLHDLAELSLFLTAAPTTLTSLSIHFDLDIEWEPGEPGILVDGHIARFTRLKKLSLGEKTFSSALFPILAQSLPSLSHLALSCGEWVEVEASKILDFLSSVSSRSTKRRPLSHFKLDAFYACVDLLPSKNPTRPSVEDGTFRIEDWWSLPSWTREFTYKQAGEIVRAAEAAGIAFSGSLLEAIEVEELRVQEEKYLLERRDDVLLSLAALFESEY
ncbi:hypothetical protein JCM10213_008698 [Rhodosporidiobolus nylandii]